MSARYRFGVFELDLAAGELRRRGAPVPLPPQALRLLELLVADAGALVTRETIVAALWPDGVHVDFDGSLNFCVARLRKVLGDRAAAPVFVETVPRRGYRFVAPVEVVRPEVTPVVPVVAVPVVAAVPRRRAVPLTVGLAVAALAILALVQTGTGSGQASDPGAHAVPATADGAYRRGLRGLRDPAHLADGTRALQEAVAAAPDAPQIWTALAEALVLQADSGQLTPAQALPQARVAADTALRLGGGGAAAGPRDSKARARPPRSTAVTPSTAVAQRPAVRTAAARARQRRGTACEDMMVEPLEGTIRCERC